MKKTTQPISPSRLRELLIYDPETGIFRWRVDKSRARRGAVAGCVCRANGYRMLRIDQGLYFGHRVAWLYAYGKWPERFLDHINGIKDDNRIANLREADCAQNTVNSGIKKNNTSGHRGVHFSKAKGKWQARIRIDGKRVYLGQFATKEDASEAYERLAMVHHGPFYRPQPNERAL